MGTEKELSKRRRGHECLISNQREDTTEYVLECQTAETVYKIRDNTPNQWPEVLKLYRQNKELRK